MNESDWNDLIYGPYQSADLGGGFSVGSGWDKTLQGLTGIFANTWSTKTLMQQNQQGQRYIEGQRLMLAQQNSGMGSLLLLAGAGLLVWALVK